MADTKTFFDDTLPEKLKGGDVAATGVYQFDIEGAGIWTLDLDNGTVAEGASESAGCVIGCSKDNFEGMLDDPSTGMSLFMTGQLTASDLGMAMSLQSILG